MRVVAIIQARIGSSRLPGKVLEDLAGRSMLARVIDRLLAARRVDEVVVATSTAPGDDAVVREAGRWGCGVHRGSEADVLQRYAQAARGFRAEAIVRVTADCPLLDPSVVDQVIDALGLDVDYASNTHTRTYPRGLDVEALHRDTLERLDRLATSSAAREHVTAFVMEQPGLFRCRSVLARGDDSDLRWTVDTEADLATIRSLYTNLAEVRERRPYGEVVAAIRARPELAAGNIHVVQKPWHEPHVA